MRVCSICLLPKEANQFYSRSTCCKRCHCQRRAERRARQRADVIQQMGGCCIRCGFSDERALQIDHVHGGGHLEYMKIGMQVRFYAKVLANPDDYQLLCANCNWIKRAENNEIGGRSNGKQKASA